MSDMPECRRVLFEALDEFTERGRGNHVLEYWAVEFVDALLADEKAVAELLARLSQKA